MLRWPRREPKNSPSAERAAKIGSHMSQVTKLVRVRHHGSPVFLGNQTITDQDGLHQLQPVWSTDADEIAGWMAAGFRFRFNQRRSCRSRHLYCEDREGLLTLVMAPSGQPVLVPIGSTVTDITDAEARRQHPHLAALPGYVLEATNKTEAQDWFAATKRRRTNLTAGRKAGRMPQFRSAKTDDARFVCWFNGGRNAVLLKTGRRSGMVTISGMNPAGHRQPGQGSRWQIAFHVRLSQDIRAYTSVGINLTRAQVVFVNEPLPVTGRAGGGAVGIDRGATHPVADSTGRFFDIPDTGRLEKQLRWHSRRMAKSRLVARRESRHFWESKRYQLHKNKLAQLAAGIARIRVDFAHKTSTQLVREFDLIGIEDLRLCAMVRKGRGKRGLNRVMHAAALGRLAELVGYKSALAGIHVIKVNPAYTSQRCHQCGHTAPENRESQAVFRCKRCSWHGNADSNAAINIRDDALTKWAASGTGQDHALAGSKSKTDPRKGPVLTTGGACDEPLTTPTARVRVGKESPC